MLNARSYARHARFSDMKQHFCTSKYNHHDDDAALSACERKGTEAKACEKQAAAADSKFSLFFLLVDLCKLKIKCISLRQGEKSRLVVSFPPRERNHGVLMPLTCGGSTKEPISAVCTESVLSFRVTSKRPLDKKRSR